MPEPGQQGEGPVAASNDDTVFVGLPGATPAGRDVGRGSFGFPDAPNAGPFAGRPADATVFQASQASGRDAPPVAPPSLGSGLAPNQIFDNDFRIERKLGEGGMGEVYCARNILNDHLVALKLIRTELLQDTEIVRRFRDEDWALRRLSHPAVVRYLGMRRESASNRLYLVMDFVDGPSLATYLAKHGPLSVTQVRQLRSRLAAGLADAHSNGVFHRDLSPDNILLEGSNLSKATIIDFGIAKVSQQNNQTQFRTEFVGKMSYASPEHFSTTAPIDGKSDLYSLGLVLAAAALGRPLDMGKDALSAARARLTRPVLTSLPSSLREEIGRLLEPDPARRPDSAQELVEVHGKSGEARARLLSIAGGAGALALVLGVTVWWNFQSGGNKPVPIPPVVQPAVDAPVVQPAPAPPANLPSPTNVPQAMTLAEGRGLLKSVAGCAWLTLDEAPSGNWRLDGLMADHDDHLGLLGRLAAGAGQRSIEDLTVVDRTTCRMVNRFKELDVLAPPGDMNALTIDAGRQPARFTIGEKADISLSLRLTGDRYIYLVAMGGDGTVNILAPGSAIRAFDDQVVAMDAARRDWTLFLGITARRELRRLQALGPSTTTAAVERALGQELSKDKVTDVRVTWLLARVM